MDLMQYVSKAQKTQCSHCGEEMLSGAKLCGACFINGHRSHAGDGLHRTANTTQGCEACDQIEREEKE